MKILWLCNITPPVVAKELNWSISFSGGWIDGALTALLNEGHELGIAFPQRRNKDLLSGSIDRLRYFAFPSFGKNHQYNSALEGYMHSIIDSFQPDLVHIWGTEFPHSLAMIRVFNHPERTLVNIQGLCSIYSGHYMGYLPTKEQRIATFRDILARDTLLQQQRKFHQRGEMEKQVLLGAGHIIGRTEWDLACTKQLAPNAKYYKCNETLRSSFYLNQNKWNLDNCERHAIFASQAGYPIKGFHQLLEAMPEILRLYPDAKLYTTGKDPRKVPFYRQNGYMRCISKLIHQNKLDDKVFFLGALNENDMCAQYLKSHVFVSASSIENSPNSLGEAMLLGMPTVSSYVGGAMDMLQDKKEGFLYAADAPYMLAHYVCRIFEDDNLAVRFGKAAHAHAAETHDVEKNKRTLLDIYAQLTHSNIIH